MSRGNKIANSSVPRKTLKTQLQVHYQRGKRGAEGERGTARQSAGEKGREQYKQNEAHVKIQERRGFVVTAATILPLPLAAYGRMQGRSQASETKHCLDAGPAEHQQPRQTKPYMARNIKEQR